MLVSIIIPVYNAEKYLSRCLKSILLQNFSKKDFEILLIDNNSTDKSPKIIDDFKREYKTLIKTFKCNKQGSSAAKNLGVSKAKGDYIWFIDADDYIPETAISDLYYTAKKNDSDLVTFRAIRKHINGKTSNLRALDTESKNFKNDFVRYGFGPWHFLIKRSWWNKNNLSFKEGIIHEDMALMSSLILFTDKISSIDKPLYYYCENKGSVLRKTEWDNSYFDIFPALENLYKIFESKNAVEKCQQELEYFFIWNLLLDSARDFSKSKEGRPGFNKSRKMLKKYFPNWRKNKYLNQKSFTTKIRCRLSYHDIVL